MERMHPPLGIDPEHHFMQRENLTFILREIKRHRFGDAFLRRALEQRPWQDLAAELGIEPNTLTKAWTRLVGRLREEENHA